MQNQFLPLETAAATASYTTPSVAEQIAETTATTPAAQAVTDLLARAERKVRRRKRQYWTTFGLMEFMLLLPMVMVMVHRTFLNGVSHPLPTPFVIIPVIVGMAALLLTFTIRVRVDAEALGRVGGTKAIPILMDALLATNLNGFDPATLQALTLLLPQMQATDAPLLTSSHRRMLNRILNQSLRPAMRAGVDDTFTLAVLKAYEQIGDAQFIPFVERLASHQPRTERERRIQQAAADCLPLLKAHVGGVDVTQTLLRASMPETNTPDTLLRPASASASAAPPESELLRAATLHDVPPTA